MSTTAPRSESFLTSAFSVFSMSVGEILWSRRTIFMVLVVGSPVIVAMVARIVQSMARQELK